MLSWVLSCLPSPVHPESGTNSLVKAYSDPVLKRNRHRHTVQEKWPRTKSTPKFPPNSDGSKLHPACFCLTPIDIGTAPPTQQRLKLVRRRGPVCGGNWGTKGVGVAHCDWQLAELCNLSLRLFVLDVSESRHKFHRPGMGSGTICCLEGWGAAQTGAGGRGSGTNHEGGVRHKS